MNEFGLINKIRLKTFPHINHRLQSGIGDDCAVITDGNKYQLVTTDAVYENTHFTRRYTPPFELGAKAAAVNISDICAMGGRPLYAFVTVGFPKNENQKYVEKIYAGLFAWFNAYGVDIAGGDTIKADRLFLSVTLLGEVEKNRIMLRKTAKAGDVIFVTGKLGASHAGLKTLMGKNKKRLSKDENSAVKKHLMPVPKFIAGRLLGESGLVSACIDISDGLMSDLLHICEESKCGAKIWEAHVPIADEARYVAQKKKEKALDYALYGGEDYELLFTVSPLKAAKFYDFAAGNGLSCKAIGKLTANRGVFRVNASGEKEERFKKTWKHF